MSEKIRPGLDLFGDPWTPPKDRRGRKAHRRSPQVAEKIAVLRATGSTVEEIVQRIGLSEPTLRKYYLREIDGGADLARQVLIETMWGKALEGNVSAARFIKDELAKGETEKFIRGARGQAAAANTVRKPLGKKAEAELAAKSAGQDTAWGDDLIFSKH